MASSTTGNIVIEWLRSLHLGQYSESFIDNGYDDLEICKQVGEPDLDAIGVLNPAHRQRLLHSVRSLREEGAAAVYFTLEEAAAARDPCRCEEEVRKEQATATVEPAKYVDEYEEGKAELVKIPRIQLKRLLRERLAQDGIRLSLQPYSTTDGDRGYLEGLASRYADLFSTHYGDVLDHLEELRRHEWDEMSPRMRVLGGPGTPQTPPSASPGSLALNNLTTSHSQPIYVPGKYSPSSCLTDKEEDEIYGFGYGVFGKQMLQRQQQQKQLLLAQPSQPLMHNQQHNYQSCLSPRSAYFYEFPPSVYFSVDNCLGTAKKKVTTFSRLLRGLKSHRKEKHGSCSPKHTHSPRQALPPQRVDTPDSVLQSGLGLGPGPDTALRSMVDPRDYDRLRFLQMNAAQPNTFEETIHRLKVQEAMKKKDKLAREQEEILRDIRHGLMNMGRDGIRGPFGDDTYMYDDEARGLSGRGHWYDEPPYESDPEDFLMGGGTPAATFQNGRVCFTLNLRNESRGEGVISLRSAGDISLARAPRRGLIIPQSGPYPTTVIPLHTARDRESGDYAASDIQSIGSRLSGISLESSRSERDNRRGYRQMSGYRIGIDPLSPASSDYEDQESETDSQHIATVHKSAEECEGVSNLAGKVRGLRQDVQRKISRLRQERGPDSTDRRTSADQAFPCSNSSFESLPSGSGSKENIELSPAGRSLLVPQMLCRARALVDYVPNIYEKDALRYKKGDIIEVINMNASGIWRGVLNNKVGNFKFANVEVLSDRDTLRSRAPKWCKSRERLWETRPRTVEELLKRIDLPEYALAFARNGYEDIELFKEIEPSDLDYLGIMTPDHRTRILAAVQLLHQLECGEGDGEAEGGGSSSEGGDSPFGRRQFPRDSGCYEGGVGVGGVRVRTSPLVHRADEPSHRPPDPAPQVKRSIRRRQPDEAECDRIERYPGSGAERAVARSGGLPGGARDDTCETDHKLNVVKFVAGGEPCASEKSSDSGVSSSSLSSAHPHRT
ncbi:SAM and SH3 domain-containing protein 1 isoform X3 [Battus philenor]|uniref:SAM and SH3 domain-containing protein 1 isoform X3 n=1 Tax=Battus philenor TaxID=42288 RepID=UPI0035D0D82A